MLRELLIYIASYIGLFTAIFYVLGLRRRREKKIPKFPEHNPPKVSIIIPAYNEEKGIAATIKSALSADYPRDKFEIIVVDDGSTDNTYKIAEKFKSKLVRLFHKENGGKGSALNLGISKSNGEFIFTMDADSIIKPNSVKNQIAYFDKPKVMSVAPIIAIYKPRNILERVQQIEYLLGVFLREAFASLNAIHVTPGAFSSYRRSFFDKYGGFKENELVEDLEMALRIQAKGYIIENCMTAIVYTHPPRKFRELAIQRRRWFVGLLRNIAKYKELFSRKTALGAIVLPIAVAAIIISLALTSVAVVRALINLRKELLMLNSINFNFLSLIDFNKYSVGLFLFSFFSSPITILAIVFVIIVIGYLYFAKSKVKEHSQIAISLPLFLVLYSFLFAFWWVVAFLYSFLDKTVSWR